MAGISILGDREALLAELAEFLDPSVAEVALSVMEKVAADAITRLVRAEFAELRQIVSELAEAQRRTEEQVKELAEAQRRTEEQVKELAEAQRRTEEQVKELAEAQKRTEQRVDRLETTVQELIEAQKRTEERLERLEKTVQELIEAQKRTEERLERLEKTVQELTEAQKRTEQRVDRLETIVQELIEAQKRTEQRLEELAEAQKRTEQRLEELAEAQKRTEQRLEELAEAQKRTEQRLDRVIAEVGKLKGDMLEIKYREKASAYFGRMLRKPRVVDVNDIWDSLEERLSAEELNDLLLIDLIVRGQLRPPRPDRGDVWLAVEVSGLVELEDVVRAQRRATWLRQAGYPAIPVVAGERITEEAESEARRLQVAVLQDGRGLLWDEVLGANLL